MIAALFWLGLLAAVWLYMKWCEGDDRLREIRRQYHAEMAAEREKIARARAASRRVLP